MTLQKALILLSFATIVCVSSIQVMFDSFSYCKGTKMIECAMRVRKINRTTAALSGEIHQNLAIGNSFETAIELHHSPLGNNQFNRYPMKIGPIRMCVFMENYWSDYFEYVARYVENVMQPNECPYGVRTLKINDWILDSAMFPLFVPPGLWKMIHTIWDSESGQNYTMEMIFKVYEDGYF